MAAGALAIASGCMLAPADAHVSSWRPASSMQHDRVLFALVPLPDGRALAVGGNTSTAVNAPGGMTALSDATAEIYDPCRDSWTLTAPMTVSRRKPAATPLADGRVLVSGGRTDDLAVAAGNDVIVPDPTGDVFGQVESLRTAEIFDPVAGSWSSTPPMAQRRFWHTSTLLADGSVLVAGGAMTPGAGAETFDPRTGVWTATGAMPGPSRTRAVAARLGDGSVLVFGGYDGTIRDDVVRFDPLTRQWSTVAAMATPRSAAIAAPLPDGTVLVAGGGTSTAGEPTASAEVFDATGRSVAVTPMHHARLAAAAVVLPDGDVIVTGGGDADGRSLGSAERYHWRTRTWEELPPMVVDRQELAATVLGDGDVLVAGGVHSDFDTAVAYADDLLASAERFASASALREGER